MSKTSVGVLSVASLAIGALLYIYKKSLLKLWWYPKFKQNVIKEFGRQYQIKTIFIFDSLEKEFKGETVIQTSFKANNSFYMYKAIYSNKKELLAQEIYEIDLNHAILWNQESYWGI